MAENVRKINRQREIYLCRAIIETLQYLGCQVWRMNAGMMPAKYTLKRGRMAGVTKTRMIHMAPAGMSDIIGMTKSGRFLAIEVKLPDGKYKPTDLQEQFIELVRNNGGVAGVAHSVEEAQKILKEETA